MAKAKQNGLAWKIPALIIGGLGFQSDQPPTHNPNI